MSSFSRFQKINQSRGTTGSTKVNSGFIMNGYPSIFITNKDDEKIQACVVNKQEKDMAYIFTQNTDQEDILPIGSVWGAKGLHWLIMEEIISIKDVGWHKYLATLCNIEINNTWGYFISAEASYINTVLRQDVLLQSQQKPLLILANSDLKIGDKIMIKGRAWRIQEEDILSTPGISYFSLEATTMSKEVINESEDSDYIIEHQPTIDADAHIEEPAVATEERATMSVRETDGGKDNIIWVEQLEEIQVPTYYSYAVFSNKKVKPIKINTNYVVFALPFGIDETDVTVKDEYNNTVIYTIKARV